MSFQVRSLERIGVLLVFLYLLVLAVYLGRTVFVSHEGGQSSLEENSEEEGQVPDFELNQESSSWELPFYGFCDSHETHIERPPLSLVINERIDELNDRIGQFNNSGEGSQNLRKGISLFYNPSTILEGFSLLRSARDVHQNGFDYAGVAALSMGIREYNAGRLLEAQSWAERAEQETHADPAPFLLQALIAKKGNDVPLVRELLRHAYELDSSEPSIALATGMSFSRTDDLELAVRSLSSYLQAYPEDTSIGGLRERLAFRMDLVRDFFKHERKNIKVLFSPEVPHSRALSVLEIVILGLEKSARVLGTERRQELTVFVYGNHSDLIASTCVQSWARAVFDGVLHLDGIQMENPTLMESHIMHETLHAQLTHTTAQAPVWLHEGLAQHVADQISPHHRKTYQFMIQQNTWIPFASLAGTFQVIDDRNGAEMAYHQSLAMIEFLISRNGPQVIRTAIANLSQGGDPRELFEYLGGNQPITGPELLRFLEESGMARESSTALQ